MRFGFVLSLGHLKIRFVRINVYIVYNKRSGDTNRDFSFRIFENIARGQHFHR